MSRQSSLSITVMIGILFLGLSMGTLAPAQEEETRRQEQRAASIEKMQKRILEIKDEMKNSEQERLQALGGELVGLYSKIDQSYQQMKKSYEHQVNNLNGRMRRMWLKLEESDTDSRKAIDKKLAILREEWDRNYKQLTATHDRHLEHLKSGLAKLRTELSDASNKAQAELEADQLEALAVWEKGHETILAINHTYAKIVGDEIAWHRKRLRKQPTNLEYSERLDLMQKRYLTLQQRVQKRVQAHLGHLDREMKLRQMRIAAKIGDANEFQVQIDQLYDRKHLNFKNLQASLQDSLTVLENDFGDTSAGLHHRPGKGKEATAERLAVLKDELANTTIKLRNCYRDQAKLVTVHVKELDDRSSTATGETKQMIEARLRKLKVLSRELKEKIKNLQSIDAAAFKG